MVEYDIDRWVEREKDPNRKIFRTAVHTILHAIAGSPFLQMNMIIKGGILLAVRYNSPRHTRDIDFSTSRKFSEINLDNFFSEMEIALAVAVDDLDYGVDCRIQSWKKNPPKPDASFPTLVIGVGYAHKIDKRKHRRLMSKNASEVVRIEYSFNEITQKIENVKLPYGYKISAYSLTDLIAEKYRALLQQETRNRYRRQDIYDLYFLLKHESVTSRENKKQILNSLLVKSESRNLEINRKSMQRKEIIKENPKRVSLAFSGNNGGVTRF